jgi:hypothetical protein
MPSAIRELCCGGSDLIVACQVCNRQEREQSETTAAAASDDMSKEHAEAQTNDADSHFLQPES